MQRKLVNTVLVFSWGDLYPLHDMKLVVVLLLPSEVEAAARLEEFFEERLGVLVSWIDSTCDVLDLDFIAEV